MTGISHLRVRGDEDDLARGCGEVPPAELTVDPDVGFPGTQYRVIRAGAPDQRHHCSVLVYVFGTTLPCLPEAALAGRLAGRSLDPGRDQHIAQQGRVGPLRWPAACHVPWTRHQLSWYGQNYKRQDW